MKPVHIRGPYRNTLCGAERDETISLMHFEGHIRQFGTECCRGIVERLCPECLKRASPIEEPGEERR